MGIRIIRTNPDPALRQKANKVKKFGSHIDKLIEDMVDTMYDANGVGLAAPQIGISKRIVVIDLGEGVIELINPIITKIEDETCEIEGCLSVPGIVGKVIRGKTITVEAVDRMQNPVNLEVDGLLAIVIQHELDHLDGILFIDSATELLDPRELKDQENEPCE